ncbi:MAG: peptidoglycan-binding protein [Clostridia bacterium]|nr:peptidoglycan-binding protein [Clostridia bacterium]
MKGIKKVMVSALAAAMVASGSVAGAAEIGCASEVMKAENMERYPSYICDDVTGKWSVRTNQADGLMDRLWTYGKANSTALCAFDLEIEGNALTGVRTPVLRFYYMDGQDINATAVSILVGETRYDLAASSTEIENERHTVEMISAPLTPDAMKLIDILDSAETASVRLIGERIYTFEMDLNTTNSRRRIETASLNGMASASVLLEEAGFGAYDLWDLSAAAWEAEYGFRPAFEEVIVVKMIGETTVDDDFGMVIRNNQTKAAKTAQEILIAHGFMSGSATSTFGENSSGAARRAQQYLGLVETGCMDAKLEKALQEGVIPAGEAARELTALGGSAALNLDRYWFASGIAPVNKAESMYTVSNRDNVFLAADGFIRNISAQEMRLFTQIEARIICNDTYIFEANVVCERDAGESLDMTMLPMAQSRLIVYGEVPAWLAGEEQSAWKIELISGSESIEYELQ